MAGTDHFQLLFGVRRSVRYHSRRQAFFEGVDRWTSFALLLLGAGSVALVLRGIDGVAVLAGCSVAVLSGLKLVFAFGLRAGQHAQFVRDFVSIEKKLVADPSPETVQEAQSNRLDVEATEPPVMRVLDALCHNELLRAMGITDPDEQVPISRLQRLTANLVSWGEHSIAKAGGAV